MITIFNRKLLIITMDMKRQSEIRNKLQGAGIDYTLKTRNLQGAEGFGNSGRSRYGTAGIRQEFSYEYRVYVHKNQYEKAQKIIQQKER